LGPALRELFAGVRGRLLVGARAHVTLYEFRVLSQDFALERVSLLTSHRRDVERIVRGGDILDGLLRPAVHAGYPGVRRPVGTVRVIGSDAGEVGRYNLVRVLLEFASQLVAERLAASSRLRPSDLRASLRPFS
jgi:hypothetical protein